MVLQAVCHGWHQQGDSKVFVAFEVLSGRYEDFYLLDYNAV
jgi:hypothetical protein